MSGGSYTFTIPGDALSTGTDTLKVSYSGDATYARASGTASVTVAKLTPTVTELPNLTTAFDTNSVNVTVNVTGAGPTPTGTVTASLPGYTSLPCTLTTGTCTPGIPVWEFPSGANTITASYSGDLNYLAGTATATVLVPTLTMSASLTNLTTANTLQVTAKVSGTGPTPTGFVNLGTLYQLGNIGGQLSAGSYTFTVVPGELAAGTETLTVQYQGDNTYLPASTTTTVTVTKVTPALSVTPSATSISLNLPLNVTGTLASNGPTPTGDVTITAAGQQFTGPVSGGAYFIAIPAASLNVGTVTLNANYSGDPFNTTVKVNSATVTVTPWVQVASAVAMTPQSSSLDTGQALPVTVVVTGAYGTPTGTVTLSGGGYTGVAWPLSGGGATYPIPANSLSVGTDILTVSYSGDPTYLPSMATATITVAQSGLHSFSVECRLNRTRRADPIVDYCQFDIGLYRHHHGGLRSYGPTQRRY